MPVETATTIKDLNENYPLAKEGVGKGDDHLRLIKSVLKNTFPNLTDPVTVDSVKINSIASFPNVTDAIEATSEDLNRKFTLGTGEPYGGKHGDVYLQYK